MGRHLSYSNPQQADSIIPAEHIQPDGIRPPIFQGNLDRWRFEHMKQKNSSVKFFKALSHWSCPA